MNFFLFFELGVSFIKYFVHLPMKIVVGAGSVDISLVVIVLSSACLDVGAGGDWVGCWVVWRVVSGVVSLIGWTVVVTSVTSAVYEK